MNIIVSIATINLDGSGLVYEDDENLDTLFPKHGSDRIPISEPEMSYYRSSDNNIFMHMDEFERIIPTMGHKIRWQWTGVRKQAEYYLMIEIQAFSEEIPRIRKALDTVFSDAQIADTAFEIPDVDFPLDVDDPEAYDKDDNYAECDEESRLRDLDILTFGNPILQWKREPAEYEAGGGIIATLGVAAGIGSFGHAFLKDFIKSMMNNHYSRKIEQLQRKVVKACKKKGRIIPPDPEAPKTFNMERDEYEYEFTQIMSDGTRNRVFIGVDSEKVTFVPYQ